MSKITEFWEYMKTSPNISPAKLKAYTRENFTEDFIDNIGKWKTNLVEVNNIMKKNVNQTFSDFTDWVDMDFNYFCTNILTIIDATIDENGTISPTDITKITEKLINMYLRTMIDTHIEKRYTISNLINTIQTPIIDFRE